MGCHTWYKVPAAKGKDNIRDYITNIINTQRTQNWWDDECEKDAIVTLNALEQLDENMSEELLCAASYEETIYFIDGEPVLFKKYSDSRDTPRIGGYPTTIIRSSNEMFEAMEKGLMDWKGETRYNFYYPKEEEEKEIKEYIKEFFKKHPDGIIEFG